MHLLLRIDAGQADKSKNKCGWKGLPSNVWDWHGEARELPHSRLNDDLARKQQKAHPLCQLSLSELCSGQHVPSLHFPGFMILWGLHIFGFDPFLTLLHSLPQSIVKRRNGNGH